MIILYIHKKINTILFNLFAKKDARAKLSDKTYVTAAAKQNACLTVAKKSPGIMFIAWFTDTAHLYKQLYVEEVLDGNHVTEARQLHASKIKGCTPVFPEHFPIHSKEDELVKKGASAKLMYIIHYMSHYLPIPALIEFMDLLKKMGMAEDEVIEHPLISKSIRTAQEKIASKSTLELSASSQQEWIDKNLK